jgi:hypothetical protein
VQPQQEVEQQVSEQWLLYWTARGQEVPCRLVAQLECWSGLDQREADAGIGPRDPILIDPRCRIDPVLGRFFRRSRFAWLAEGSRVAYARDYRLFFSFLWGRGRYWHEAGPDDLLDWEAWRRRDQPGGRISGSKWQRELAALRLLYEWAENASASPAARFCFTRCGCVMALPFRSRTRRRGMSAVRM